MRALFFSCFVTVFATTAHAQVHPYAIAGPAGAWGFVNVRSITFHAGGGADVFLGNKYVAVGGDGGFFDRLITVSVNGSLHAGNEERVQPFVTGGYTRFGIGDEASAFDAWSVGAGADMWLGRHAGIRLELRDFVRPDPRGRTDYWSFRGGVVFR